VTEQCTNAKMPGYTGFVPSVTAEHIYGHTKASVGHTAMMEQTKRRHQRSAPGFEGLADHQASGGSGAHNAESLGGSRSATRGLDAGALSHEHPLGKSQAAMVRNHWVPTIPGYGGHVPGKHAENVCGGGIMHTCKMAGRAIAERNPLPGSHRAVTMQDNMQRSRLVDYHHTRNSSQDATVVDERVRLAGGIRDHCSKQIPGYTGHIPRVSGESIYGATARNRNLIAADYCEDHIFHPEDHARRCCEPQAPQPRQLRL